MIDDSILITQLNDFIFCPVSIYFHNLYGAQDKLSYQRKEQINGSHAHEAVDEKKYSTSRNVLMGMDVYCEDFRIIGKIDIFDIEKCLLRERKKKIRNIYDGYLFQVYAQCLALREMGYEVRRIELYSVEDNKTYKVELPENNPTVMEKMISTIEQMRNFSFEQYVQTNVEKCRNCIYEPLCDRSIKEVDC